MTTTTRRPATAADCTKGAIVYKGKGGTAWRVVMSSEEYVMLCKATTAKDPVAGCSIRISVLTVLVSA